MAAVASVNVFKIWSGIFRKLKIAMAFLEITLIRVAYIQLTLVKTTMVYELRQGGEDRRGGSFDSFMLSSGHF